MVLVVTGLGAVFLGLMTLATRDASPSALAELAGTEQAPEALVPARAAYWPLVGAFGAALVVLGLVISNVLFIAGLFVLLGVLIEWTVLAWSDRATGDPDANHHLRNRIMAPFEVPLVGFLIVATVVASVSRLLLTSTEFGAVLVAALLATLILALGAIIAGHRGSRTGACATRPAAQEGARRTTAQTAPARPRREAAAAGAAAEHGAAGAAASAARPDRCASRCHRAQPASAERAAHQCSD
jgi:hypothetical protein